MTTLSVIWRLARDQESARAANVDGQVERCVMGSDQAQDRIIELDLGYVPEAAVSGPLLIQDEGRAFLTFNAMRLGSDGMREPAGTAIVELQGCLVTRFGYPNDEALPGHRLYQRGLGAYGIFEVLDSSWVAQLDQQNRVSFPDAGIWATRHVVFVFHDSLLECIVHDIALTISQRPYAQILRTLTEHFLT